MITPSFSPRLVSRATLVCGSRPSIHQVAFRQLFLHTLQKGASTPLAPHTRVNASRHSPFLQRPQSPTRCSPAAASYPRHASTSTHTPSSPAIPPLPVEPRVAVTPPSLEAIRAEGVLDDDVELLPPEEARIKLTPEAVQQLVAITAREPPGVLDTNLALRVGVDSGGCHGYQYTMALSEERGADDYVFRPEGVDCIPVVVDLVSLGLLKGATLHHATELIGSSFRLQDNPQAKEGGACGCGISWEAKP